MHMFAHVYCTCLLVVSTDCINGDTPAPDGPT